MPSCATSNADRSRAQLAEIPAARSASSGVLIVRPMNAAISAAMMPITRPAPPPTPYEIAGVGNAGFFIGSATST